MIYAAVPNKTYKLHIERKKNKIIKYAKTQNLANTLYQQA